MRNPLSAASFARTKTSANDANRYSCRIVNWEDSQNAGAAGGGGSDCPTDTRLCEKSGNALLYTCRPEKWNETFGRVSADDVVVLVGNHQAPSPYESSESLLHPITLASFLKRAGRYAEYIGAEGNTDLFDANLDKEVLIRFQTVFLPVRDAKPTEFCAEAYNRNDPSNAFVLCTTQGAAFQLCGAGATKIFHHSVDCQGQVHSQWMKANSSPFSIDESVDIESRELAAVSMAPRKVTPASAVGFRAMGSRFNALMTVQIPLLEHNPDLGDQPYPTPGTADSASFPQRVVAPKRDSSQHIILTIVTYNTVAGEVPSAEDIRAAIDDMERLYEACSWDQNENQAVQLSTFARSDPTVPNATNNIIWQSYHPPTRDTQNISAF